MYYSLFEIFTVGIGPSSSHTVGPMRAANRYLENLCGKIALEQINKIDVVLYGSLALTGLGHGTLNAVVYGLMGLQADTMDLDQDYIGQIQSSKKLSLANKHFIDFDMDKNIILAKETFLPEHSNGMKFSAYDKENNLVLEETYFSVGGGTIARSDEMARRVEREPFDLPYQFNSCKELIEMCEKNNLTVSELVLKNEESLRSKEEVKAGIMHIRDVMQQTIERGISVTGVLPGGLGLQRRANNMFNRLEQSFKDNNVDALMMIDWVNLWAFAVAEENASGGKIVTAPTMGAAGVLPAVLRYIERFAIKKSALDLENAIITFLTTASAICSLYRTNASISGAEVGCQGEVGVACSMAAAGLVAIMGGNTLQIENAAEIAMEHNLGLTCDPVNGLVQAPCIERNAMGAIKAINAARLAIRGSGKLLISLDSIIKTMYETGLSLDTDYKETSLGGLAINFANC